MANIDPHNLGQPVYKYGSVITEKDLDKFYMNYRRKEIEYMEKNRLTDALQACAGHAVIERLMAWILAGKPGLEGEKEDESHT